MVGKPNPQLWLSPGQIPASHGYVPTLDGLRAVSILLVMVGHLVSEKLAPGGFGVQVFFAISGFLIARLMLAEHKANGSVSLPRFYLRRFLRLYPVTLVYSLLVVGVFLAAGLAFSWGELWAVLGYYANYYFIWFSAAHGGRSDLPFGIFWSLAVEEHFYLLFPPVFLLLKGRPNRLFWAMLAVCAGCLVLRLAAAIADPALLPTRDLYYRTEFRLDAIAWGVLLAAICETDWGRRLLKTLVNPIWFSTALLVITGTFVFRDPFFRDTWRYSLQGLGLFVIFAGLLFSPRYGAIQRILNLAPIVWIGRVSYSLYVWHLCTPALSRWMAPNAGWMAQSAIQFLLSFILAALSFYLMEQPIARWRRRLGGVTAPISSDRPTVRAGLEQRPAAAGIAD